jgi:mRNA-degrading endonuclease toxin of MazEF toxin-antitoxin module
MAPAAAPGLRGAIVWAIVAYVPEAPFRLWLGPDRPPAELPDARTYAQQVRHQGLEAEQTFLVAGKLRPIVLLQDRPRRVLREIVALRMVRLETLSESQRADIRDQREPSLFHLPVRPAKYGLSKEMAIDLNALVRVHASAMLPKAVGRLDDNEMRLVGQRLVEHLDVDLEPLLARLVEERLEQLTDPDRA